jgi:ABC-type branched-subunit amino acid transport system substrate-binding protein
MRRGAPLILLLAAGGCHVGESLTDCRQDADCPLGERCHPDGRFCELDTGPVRIGASIALTGELGSFGTDIRTGIELGVAVVNESGGILGRPAELDLRDDQTSVEVATENVEALVDTRVAGIVGPLTSGQTLASQAASFEARVLQISPTAGSPDLSPAQPARDRYLFRTVSTIERGSAAAIALFAAAGPTGGTPCREMAILHSDDTIGVAYRDAVQALFEKQGGCVVLRQSFPATEVIDYGDIVQSLVSSGPDCALLVAFPEAGVEIAGELAERVDGDPAWDPFFWIGTTSLHGSAFLRASGFHPRMPAEGMYGGDEDTNPPTREYGELRERYNGFFGHPSDQELPIFVTSAYDATMLLALAVSEAGTTADRVRIRDGLWAVSGTGPEHRVLGPVDYGEAIAALARGERIHYKGASSRLQFDDFGTTSVNPSLIWRVEAGEFVTVERYSEEQIEALLAAPAMPGCG